MGLNLELYYLLIFLQYYIVTHLTFYTQGLVNGRHKEGKDDINTTILNKKLVIAKIKSIKPKISTVH